MSPLENHVLPKLRDRPVEAITGSDLAALLKPIWNQKPETARKALGRIGIVLKYAFALGLSVDVDAVRRAKTLLGSQPKTTVSIPHIVWRDMPLFYQSLTDQTPTQLALRFLILTGMRSKSVRYLHVRHIENDLWVIPPELLKGRQGTVRKFRVPLSEEAQTVLRAAWALQRDGYFFPSERRGVLSSSTMRTFMNRQGLEARPHGFRASLRTWMAEATDTPEPVADMVLAHGVKSEVQKAYRRTDYLEERRAVLEKWADFLSV